ncbi:MAG: hypothetical protein ACI9LY_001172 [Arenicella sp.]|jgi:hypothetical protein
MVKMTLYCTPSREGEESIHLPAHAPYLCPYRHSLKTFRLYQSFHQEKRYHAELNARINIPCSIFVWNFHRIKALKQVLQSSIRTHLTICQRTVQIVSDD